MSPMDLISWVGALALSAALLSFAGAVVAAAIQSVRKRQK